MIPLFKSHYSIGKSILRIDNKNNSSSSKSIFEIAKNEGLKEVVLVEDSLTGFLSSYKASIKFDVKLIFGLRLTCCDLRSSSSKSLEDCHKIIVFAKTDAGCKLLNKIFSKTYEMGGNSIELSKLKELWSNKDLLLSIPFYDSFIYNNLFCFSQCTPSFSFTNPLFFIENNDLPFDSIIKSNVLDFCEKYKFKTTEAKSIFYESRDDFEAFQTYKCICGRSGWQGRAVSLEKPNLDHCGSREFCIESWRESK